jgi:hypothetical protein
MTHDEENDRNEAWLRSVLDGLTASNSSAEAIAQKLYAFTHGGAVAALPASVLRFETLLNEPTEFEDQTRVREYRHQMWPRWQEVVTDVRRLTTSMSGNER